MRLLPRPAYRLFPVLAALLLAACGGGSGGGEPAPGESPAPASQPAPPPAPAANFEDYFGTWKQACSPSGNNVWTERHYILSRLGDTTATYVHLTDHFDNAQCQGDPIHYLDTGGTLAWLGQTQVVDGVTASQVTMSMNSYRGTGPAATLTGGFSSTPGKQILAITEGNLLREGDRTAPGPDGFPTRWLPHRYVKE